MDINRFYVKDGRIALNTYKIIVRWYNSLEKTDYTETPHYVDDDGAYELEVNYVPKHQLLEIVEKTPFDNADYE